MKSTSPSQGFELLRSGAEVLDWLDRPRQTSAVLWYLNPHTLWLYRRGAFGLAPSDAVVADGGVMARSLTRRFGRRCDSLPFDMSGMAPMVLDALAGWGGRIALVGGRSDENARAAARLGRDFAGLNLVFTADGYTPDRAAMIKRIADARPQVILLSVGAPRQEQLAEELRSDLSGAVIITCGAFVRQTAETSGYYPGWATRRELRWFYRSLREPHIGWRVVTRYLPYILRDRLRPLPLPIRDAKFPGDQTNSS